MLVSAPFLGYIYEENDTCMVGSDCQPPTPTMNRKVKNHDSTSKSKVRRIYELPHMILIWWKWSYSLSSCLRYFETLFSHNYSDYNIHDDKLRHCFPLQYWKYWCLPWNEKSSVIINRSTAIFSLLTKYILS